MRLGNHDLIHLAPIPDMELGAGSFGPSDDRLLLLNLGADVDCTPMPEPLLAPPAGHRWQVAWASEDVRYGGTGAPSLRLEANWLLPGQAAFVLTPTAM